MGGYHLLLFEYRGGYHEYPGGVKYHGGAQIAKDDTPHISWYEHPLQYSRYLPRTHDIHPSAEQPMVLNTHYTG